MLLRNAFYFLFQNVFIFRTTYPIAFLGKLYSACNKHYSKMFPKLVSPLSSDNNEHSFLSMKLATPPGFNRERPWVRFNGYMEKIN